MSRELRTYTLRRAYILFCITCVRACVHLYQLDIINQYGLTAKAVNGKVLVEIRKGMYGPKQVGRIANDCLKKHLKASGYVPCRYTPGIFTHISRKISFALCIDDFGVKYTDKANNQHLLTCLEKMYKFTTDWEGKLYLGMTLNWNYAEK